MSRGLKQWQKTVLLKNYLICQNKSRLAAMANCTYYEIKKFIDNTDVKDFIVPKETKAIEKEPFFNDEQLKSYRLSLGIEEPEFSEIEEHTEVYDPVGVRIESINGKQCTVFQSRMNY